MELPRAGSFRDALMYELDLRQRDIRYTEVALITAVLRIIGGDLTQILMDGMHLKGKPLLDTDRIDRMLEVYRDRLFHYGYLPTYERRLAELMHGKGEFRLKTEEERQAWAKLERMTEKDP